MNLNNDWELLLKDEFSSEYFLQLMSFVDEEYQSQKIYPAREDIFNALKYTPFSEVKVVILGQDPYYRKGQAHGLSFSVREEEELPASLLNIFKELQTDLGCNLPKNGCLTNWARQGVLLLNVILSVREGAANSHKGRGWEIFTNKIISLLNQRERPVVFILWGKQAEEKQQLIDLERHYIIKAVHPSPLSAYRGFFGSRPFSKANECLKMIGCQEIDWENPNP